MPGPFVLLQHSLPHHRLTRLVGRFSRSPWLQARLIDWFIARYGVDLTEAEPGAREHYENFHDLFTRALKPGARPLPEDKNLLVSPADGVVSQLGPIEDGALLQAKGMEYSVERLLGGDETLAASFHGGHFATIYLAPRDYHRVHMPLDGKLLRTRYIPGRLFSVNPLTTKQVPELFCRNERLVCLFETDIGQVAVLLVGAMIVAGIETVWNGRPYVAGRAADPDCFAPSPASPITLARGAELGHFRFGSTVIVLLPPGGSRLNPEVNAGDRILMGQALGEMLLTGASPLEEQE